MPLIFTNQQPLTFGICFGKIFHVVFNFVYLMAINIIGAYILEMRGTILDLIEENFTLVDRMGEGLLILNDNDG